MMNDKQIARTLQKLIQFEQTLENRIFQPVDRLKLSLFITMDRRHTPPEARLFSPVEDGYVWRAEQDQFAWLRSSYTVPDSLDGRSLFLKPNMAFYEALLWVNGKPFGEYANKIVVSSRGNHYCNLLKRRVRAGETLDIALEAYAGTDNPGVMPFSPPTALDYTIKIDPFEICVKDERISDFAFDLRTANELASSLEDSDFRRAQIINALLEVHRLLTIAIEDAPPEVFADGLDRAGAVLKDVLARKNAGSMPTAAVIGHSHMDTAWLWEIDETIKKCARTYSNQLSLMEQYPEYRFFQSSAYHAELMRRHYPAVFEGMRQRAREGRYEMCGSAWVECDCNLTGGESMIRQFLWGQSFTKEHFGAPSTVFFLPDTFGYSAAIPQIMLGCGIRYFLTSKLGWNDTTDFPYDTFYWQGIDGTRVFSHLHPIHIAPTPETLNQLIRGTRGRRGAPQKAVAGSRLIPFGFGDGGGGPEYEMIEMARRCRDTEGCPKTSYTLISAYMDELERTAVQPNVYVGDLYLQGHRGTLTTGGKIKRNNRLAETALRCAELYTVQKAVRENAPASGEALDPYMETLLVNQFHDILPGTSIAAVTDRCHREMDEVIRGARAIAAACLPQPEDPDGVTLHNPLSFDRADAVRLPYREGRRLDCAARQQPSVTLDDTPVLAVGGLELPAFGSAALRYTDGETDAPSPFSYDGETLVTPYARIAFDGDGYLRSFIDTRVGRELVESRSLPGDASPSYPFNAFLMAEDVPLQWDNWDLDADLEYKFLSCARLLDRRVVADGGVEFRLRSTYALSPVSTLTQDMVVYADSPRVDFDTRLDWHDKHRLLKVAFDTTVNTSFARQEIQFGYAQRPTTRNTADEQAMFETVNHKYTDLSEPGYGAALLNDCKYGITVQGGRMRLTLIKSGVRPDVRADEGEHRFTYALLPHAEGFGAAAVVRPAYALNVPPLLQEGLLPTDASAAGRPFLSVDRPNILIETVKPCHGKAERAFIVRLYEAEGTYTAARLRLGLRAAGIQETDMLEQPLRDFPGTDEAALSFHAFEIKTLKILY